MIDGRRSFILTNRYRLALPINREATYPLAERQTVHTRAEYNYYQLLGLAGGGVCPAGAVTGTAVRSYRTISPLPVSRRSGALGWVFSVALSRGVPPVVVSHHRALSCSDFPPARFWRTSGRPTHSFQLIIYFAKKRRIYDIYY